MSWTEKQCEAIETEGMNLLVAAAAGSGKTSVLVERIIRKLLDEKNGADIDELLVVTFTRAAAGEMRARIAEALNEKLRVAPDSRRLERQLVLLNAASISTFDAFCQSVVRKYFHELDLDPKFRIAGEEELALLRRDVMEELFEEKYGEGDADFLRLVDAYTTERGDERLYGLIFSLYRFSCSQPQPLLWLRDLKKPFHLERKGTFASEHWMDIVLAHCRLLAGEGIGICRYLIDVAASGDFDFRLSTYEQELSSVQAFADCLERFSPDEAGWERLRQAALSMQFGRMRSAPRGLSLDKAVKEELDELRDRLKEDVKTLQESYFSALHADVMEDIGRARPYVDELCCLTEAFSRRYLAAKRRRTIVDFSDVAHYCLQLLCRDYDEMMPPEEMRPSDTALALRKKYKEILCDEYQDTNGVQEAILRLVRRENNFFAVGDVKQSIYRFRSADSDLFLQKYTSYQDGGTADRRVLLAQNFRSRKSILDGVNFLFGQLMSPSVVELSYEEAERLNAGREFPAFRGSGLEGPIEMALFDLEDAPEEEVDAESGGLSLEASYIGRRIQELMRQKTQVVEKNGDLRPLEYRDIVVLLRAVEGKAEHFSSVLKSMDIPAYAPADSGYFRQAEIRVMLSVLQIVDNPLQDIPLAASLCSQIAGLCGEDLARMRLALPEGSLWQAVQNYLKNGRNRVLKGKIAAFLERLAFWRDFAKLHSVPELIRRIFYDTGYYEYVGGLRGGELRQANLRILYDRASQYERTNYRGLFRFLRFVERMQRARTDLASARTLGENENVVRIMSIHKSKGLEFPVVFLADTGKKFNFLDAKQSFLVNKKFGLGAKAVDSELEYQYPTLPYTAISRQLRLETKAEELRILYVALTRAKEKLILTGRAKNLARKLKTWRVSLYRRERLLPDYVIAGAESYLDWLGMSLIRHRDGGALRVCMDGAQEFSSPFPDDASRWQLQIISGDAPESAGGSLAGGDFCELLQEMRPFEDVDLSLAEKVRTVLEFPYDDATLQEVPSKLSVTELKRRFAALEQEGASLFKYKPIRRRPLFMQEKKPLTGSEYGTLVHSAMQYMDYTAKLDAAEVERQLDTMVAQEKLRPEHRALLPAAKIARYFAGTLGQRMKKAGRVWREMPFSALFAAQEFYPQVASAEEVIFVQGTVDVLFAEKDGLVLVDYKTDRSEDEAELVEKYRLQLQVYAAAVARIFKMRVKEKYLYLFERGRTVRVE